MTKLLEELKSVEKDCHSLAERAEDTTKDQRLMIKELALHVRRISVIAEDILREIQK